MNIQFIGNSSDGHSSSPNANCTLPPNLRHLCQCAKLHISEWPFFFFCVATLGCLLSILIRHTCELIISTKEKCSPTQILTDLGTIFKENGLLGM